MFWHVNEHLTLAQETGKVVNLKYVTRKDRNLSVVQVDGILAHVYVRKYEVWILLSLEHKELKSGIPTKICTGGRVLGKL